MQTVYSILLQGGNKNASPLRIMTTLDRGNQTELLGLLKTTTVRCDTIEDAIFTCAQKLT